MVLGSEGKKLPIFVAIILLDVAIGQAGSAYI